MLWKKVVEEIDNRVRPETPTLAVKFLEKKEDIPERSTRPKRDYGHHMAICQALAMAGRNRNTAYYSLVTGKIKHVGPPAPFLNSERSNE